MLCNVSPHLTTNTYTNPLFPHVLRHDDINFRTLALRDTSLSERAGAWGIKNGGVKRTATCRCPHLFLFFSSSPVAMGISETRVGCTALSFVVGTSDLGMVDGFVMDADTGSLPTIGAG
jgi:hypothetical protein